MNNDEIFRNVIYPQNQIKEVYEVDNKYIKNLQIIPECNFIVFNESPTTEEKQRSYRYYREYFAKEMSEEGKNFIDDAVLTYSSDPILSIKLLATALFTCCEQTSLFRKILAEKFSFFLRNGKPIIKEIILLARIFENSINNIRGDIEARLPSLMHIMSEIHLEMASKDPAWLAQFFRNTPDNIFHKNGRGNMPNIFICHDSAIKYKIALLLKEEDVSYSKALLLSLLRTNDHRLSRMSNEEILDNRKLASDLYQLAITSEEPYILDEADIYMNLIECGHPDYIYWQEVLNKLYQLAPKAKEHMPQKGESPRIYGNILRILAFHTQKNSEISNWALNAFKELTLDEEYFKKRADRIDEFLLVVCGAVARQSPWATSNSELYKISLEAYWKIIYQLEREKSPLIFRSLFYAICCDDKEISESATEYYIKIFENFAKIQPKEVAEQLRQLIQHSLCTFQEKNLYKQKFLIKVHKITLPILEEINAEAMAIAKQGFRHWSD
jgi:hypothetical protein